MTLPGVGWLVGGVGVVCGGFTGLTETLHNVPTITVSRFSMSAKDEIFEIFVSKTTIARVCACVSGGVRWLHG